LNLPEVGASRDTWGALLNDNFNTLDSFVFMAAPIGMILDYAGSTAPPGYLICDGRLVSRITYSALFAVIGTTFNAGDGSTTFGLPACNGRSLIGPGSFTDSNGAIYNFSLGYADGAVFNTITQATLPNYTLITNNSVAHNHGGQTLAASHQHTTDAQGSHNHGGTQWNQTGMSVSDPGHQHYYNQGVIVGASGMAAGGNYNLTPYGVLTSANTTGIGLNDPGHVHGIAYDGSHAHTTTYTSIQLGISADGVHQHNVPLGGGAQPFRVLNPILSVTKIIYAGSQAAAVTSVSAAVMTIEHEPLERSELEELREEIAQLKALLMPPPQRRALSSPVRGPH
jgi:microcystin-dependent protein